MDALGINWQYLLLQCISFVLFVVFVLLIVFLGFTLIRSRRPEMLSKYVMDLEITPEGLVIPGEVLEGSGDFELRKFGKSLIVIAK